MVSDKTNLANGEKLEFSESPYYFTISTGKMTWYWIQETGEYDGTSHQIAD